MSATPLSGRGRRLRIRSSRTARRAVATVVSVLLVAAGVALTVVGIVGWVAPRQEPVRLTRGAEVELTATPLFDPGVTLFSRATSTGSASSMPRLDCLLTGPQGERPLTEAGDLREIGTRVRDGVSLMPVAEIGRIGTDERITCRGAYVGQATVWIMPTLASPSPVAMSVVVGGVGCLGLAMLANPRVRGFSVR